MTLVAPDHIRGRIRGEGERAKIAARRGFVRRSLVAGHTVEQIATALDVPLHQMRKSYGALLDDLAGRAKPSKPRAPRDVINIDGQPVSLAPLPWPITTDPRHETAPRHRGLIGGRVERSGYDMEAAE